MIIYKVAINCGLYPDKMKRNKSLRTLALNEKVFLIEHHRITENPYRMHLVLDSHGNFGWVYKSCLKIIEWIHTFLTSWSGLDSYDSYDNIEIGDVIMHRMIIGVMPNRTWIVVDKIMHESLYELIYLCDDGTFTKYDYELGT